MLFMNLEKLSKSKIESDNIVSQQYGNQSNAISGQ